jgi:hypothetical protein
VEQELGYQRIESDCSIYLYIKGELRITVPVYIDNITLACKDLVLIDRAVEEVSKHFKLRDLGPTKFLLSVEISQDQDNHSISLSQRQYIIDMLKRYGMQDCNPITTPLVPGTKLSGQERMARVLRTRTQASIGSVFVALHPRSRSHHVAAHW